MENDCEFNKILPVNQMPMVSTYPEYGALFSLLDLDDENIGGWITTNFLHLYCYREGFTVFKNHFFLLKQCPFLHSFVFPREYIVKTTNISDIIHFSITNDFYILLNLDRYYIKGVPEYHKTHMSHQTLIYGYNQKDGIVFASDNLNKGKYVHALYCLSDINCAFENVFLNGYKDDEEILIIKRIECERYFFDLKFLLKELYLFIEPETLNLEEYYRFEDTYCYNINAIDYLKGIIANDYNFAIIRSFYLLYERNKLMKYRIHYLYRNNYIKFKDDLLDQNQQIDKLYKFIINLILKAQRKKRNNFQNILENIDIVIKKEIKFTNKFIKEIQDHNTN